MDPTLCREHVSRLLSDESKALAALEELLEREHDLLVANDVPGFERLTGERQDRVGTLVRLEDERRVLCRMHGHTPDIQGLERLLAWCDPTGSLRERMAAVAAGAARCRELNDRNGMLVTARLHRVQSLLQALGGDTVIPATYAPRGAHAAPRIGSVLAAEA